MLLFLAVTASKAHNAYLVGIVTFNPKSECHVSCCTQPTDHRARMVRGRRKGNERTFGGQTPSHTNDDDAKVRIALLSMTKENGFSGPPGERKTMDQRLLVPTCQGFTVIPVSMVTWVRLGPDQPSSAHNCQMSEKEACHPWKDTSVEAAQGGMECRQVQSCSGCVPN